MYDSMCCPLLSSRSPTACTLSARASRHAKCAVCIVLLAAILPMAGCGGSAARQSLEGTVTLDGLSLEKGQITFIPQPGTPGPTAGAEIRGGTFAVPAAGGPLAGKFRVEITASRPSNQKVADRFTGKLVDAYEQYILRKYNAESQIEAEVRAGEANRFEYALKSK